VALVLLLLGGVSLMVSLARRQETPEPTQMS